MGVRGQFFPEAFEQIFNPTIIFKEEIQEARVLPWFYECNKDRYIYWENKPDLRLSWSEASSHISMVLEQWTVLVFNNMGTVPYLTNFS